MKPVAAGRFRVELGIDESVLEKFRLIQDLLSESRQSSASLEETFSEVVTDYFSRHHTVEKAKRARSSEPREDQVSTAVIHQVNLRDQRHCQAKLPDGGTCGATRWLHLHHLKPVNEGGGHTVENLVTLCSRHHRWVHRR